MPAGRVDQTLYGGTQGLAGLNVAVLYKPGELGKHGVDNSGIERQIVQLDSGATSSTGAGVVAANQLAFWKDKANYIVTNDKAQAIGGPTGDGARNAVAGVFTAAVTAGFYGTIALRGKNVNVATDGGGVSIGDNVVAKGTGTNTAVGTKTAQGTAPPVNSVGICTTAEAASVTVVTLNLPEVP